MRCEYYLGGLGSGGLGSGKGEEDFLRRRFLAPGRGLGFGNKRKWAPSGQVLGAEPNPDRIRTRLSYPSYSERGLLLHSQPWLIL